MHMHIHISAQALPRHATGHTYLDLSLGSASCTVKARTGCIGSPWTTPQSTDAPSSPPWCAHPQSPFAPPSTSRSPSSPSPSDHPDQRGCHVRGSPHPHQRTAVCRRVARHPHWCELCVLQRMRVMMVSMISNFCCMGRRCSGRAILSLAGSHGWFQR